MAYNSITFAENEEGSPWAPYHVSQGFDRDTSTVSVFATWGNVWTEGSASTGRTRSRGCSRASTRSSESCS